MRLTLRVLLGVVAAMLAVQPGSILAQKSKPPQRTEFSAEFRDAIGDRIRSDGGGAYYSNQITPSYPNDVFLTSSGSLSMRIQKNRQVVFAFVDLLGDSPIGADGTATCREWGTSPPAFFYEYPPAFLTNGGQPDNDIAWLGTLGSFPYDAVTGTWGPYTSGYFDLKSIDVEGEAYVALNIRFDIVEQNESFFVGFAFHLWVEPGVVTTIVKISRTSTKTWLIETLPPDHPLAAVRGMQADQANLFMVAPSERRGHGSGNCDLGDWSMPFAMTLTDLTK